MNKFSIFFGEMQLEDTDMVTILYALDNTFNSKKETLCANKAGKAFIT